MELLERPGEVKKVLLSEVKDVTGVGSVKASMLAGGPPVFGARTCIGLSGACL